MNDYQPHQHHRRSIRLRGFDYTQEGGYFITIMTQRGDHLFGTVVHGVVQLSEMGAIAHQCWLDIPKHFSRAVLDEFVVMPNHIHGIIFLTNDSSVTKPADAKATDGVTNGVTDGVTNGVTNGAAVGATHASPLPRPLPRGPQPHSVGAIVGSFKSAVTRHINALNRTPGITVWQRNYYEHIIRSEQALNRIRHYILANPSRWQRDRYR